MQVEFILLLGTYKSSLVAHQLANSLNAACGWRWLVAGYGVSRIDYEDHDKSKGACCCIRSLCCLIDDCHTSSSPSASMKSTVA
ncbi:hypothetical protein PVAP13_6KG089270 [Panicum virgatum]|uniref:Uncharacterized protein n=1 Tax=Panicum virgatum TaxID=38727 RepID=A0A8T0RBA6_PANVG|nr:hypothetical protein PVAP13_6KG089270 [Panicum virgatum]